MLCGGGGDGDDSYSELVDDTSSSRAIILKLCPTGHKIFTCLDSYCLTDYCPNQIVYNFP